MKIITYPHPTLRRVAKPVRRVDAELKRIVREMFDLMYEAKGIGLAANQVDMPIRLFIVNLEAEAGKGEELVFINPVLSRPKGSDEAEEGCLSLPGLYGPVAHQTDSPQRLLAHRTGVLRAAHQPVRASCSMNSTTWTVCCSRIA